MKTISLIAILLISNSVFALTPCGNSKEDRRYPQLDWVKATNYKALSSYIKLNGILCVGLDRGSNTISRIHYRDDSGVVVTSTKSALQKRDVTFLRQSDFPTIARVVTRNVDPLTLKITSEKKTSSATDYTISLKFVRNMAKGFSKTDIRELVVKARFYTNGRYDVFYGNAPTSRTTFDLVSLNIGGDLKVGTIKFYDGQAMIKSVQTITLNRANR